MALDNEQMRGAYNAVAPKPVRNADFGKAIAGALKRPGLMRVPVPALRIAIGEAAEYASGGPRALADRLQKAGYRFFFGDLDRARRRLFLLARARARFLTRALRARGCRKGRLRAGRSLLPRHERTGRPTPRWRPFRAALLHLRRQPGHRRGLPQARSSARQRRLRSVNPVRTSRALCAYLLV